MAQRHVVYFNWKNHRRGKTLVEEYLPRNGVRRPIILGIENEQELSTENSRLRKTSHQTESAPATDTRYRDFTGYFHSAKREGDPHFVATSHTSPIPLARRKSILPTFPVQSLRWNPHVESSSFEDLETFEEEEESISRGNSESCGGNHSSSWTSSSSTVKPRLCRNNIVTFCDACTMTPRLCDKSCSCDKSGSDCGSSTRESEVSVSSSEIAVRDTRARMNFVQLKCNPESILKKDNKRQVYGCDDYVDYKSFYHEGNERNERDVCYRDNFHKPTKDNCIESFLSTSNKKSNLEPCVYRKNIYNEGISDSVSNRVALMPTTCPSHIRWNRSRASMRIRDAPQYYHRDEIHIPHSHVPKSKYHHNCKIYQSKRRCHDYDEERRSSATCYNQKPIKLPKKVLASKTI